MRPALDPFGNVMCYIVLCIHVYNYGLNVGYNPSVTGDVMES
jgi:hypothetical protein